MKDMEKVVFSYPRLAERVGKRSGELEKARKILKEIKSDLSRDTVSAFGQLIDHTFAKLYDGVNLELPADMDFKKLVRENHVILIPNHQSHADYLGLSYVIWTKFQECVYIAGGINLNIFPIGTLFRKSGCFFIRRSFHNDILYKLVLEGYLFYLLHQQTPIEFFFEGGRSRSGKLLPPRFGLFQMILEAYGQMEKKKPLLFVPVSIVHEVVPEQKAHAKELGGAKKSKERTAELLKIFKLFNKKLGTIHLKIGSPIVPQIGEEIKKSTQDLAFECYRAVGKGMMLTPTSLLSLVMLDEPTGAMTWSSILSRARAVLAYCEKNDVPYSSSLKRESFESSLKGALNLLLNNKKIKTIHAEKLGDQYYTIKEECRVELLYFKNTILHHFLIPNFIFSAWMYVFNGTLKNDSDLKKFYLSERKHLKYEFYLPTVKELYHASMKVLSECVGRPIKDLKEVFNFNHQEVYSVAKNVGGLSRSFAYIHEGYYVGALALKHLKDEEFNLEKFRQVSKEIFELERSHGRIIKYPESWSVPLINNALLHFESIGLAERVEAGKFRTTNIQELNVAIEKYVKYLTELLSFNLQLQKEET